MIELGFRRRSLVIRQRRQRLKNVGIAVIVGLFGALAISIAHVAPSDAIPAQGYVLVGSDGGAFNYGDLGYWGSEAGTPLTKPVVGIAKTHDAGGYIEAAGDGGVFQFGDAPFYGSIYAFGNGSSQSWFGGNIVGIALTPDNHGYYLAANTGVVCAFGDASAYNYGTNAYYSSGCWYSINLTGGPFVTGIAADPNGGYWLVQSNGGVLSYGGAPYLGSVPGLGIAVSNVVGISSTANGNGYWLVGSDGGVFNFGGSAAFYGSYGGNGLTDVVGISSTPDSQGYWLSRNAGNVLSFGDAAFLGSMEYNYLAGPIVGIS